MFWYNCKGDCFRKKVGIIDLTRGSWALVSVEIRDSEAKKAASILGVLFRENLSFKDGFFTNDKAHQLELI